MRVRGCHGKGVYQTEMTVFTVSRGKPVFNLSDGVKTKRTVRSVTRIIYLSKLAGFLSSWPLQLIL